MFGVFAWGCPPRQPTQSFRSSTAMNSTLGCAIDGAAWSGCPATPHRPRRRTSTRRIGNGRFMHAFPTDRSDGLALGADVRNYLSAVEPVLTLDGFPNPQHSLRDNVYPLASRGLPIWTFIRGTASPAPRQHEPKWRSPSQQREGTLHAEQGVDRS